ncbi:hypothetical protein [Planctomicrobium piriforme]|uniref:Uncharacterized protein n=1 Tax=Planctomicrobium piriforme TaxID=1576369 RepID=A0A1I3DGY5_9PLAN|nr:hypothetical protein [Planctomicrobium piriforme]SFH85751.1 hypothetical protein SAMN05421753_103228 [Planctomicrobium piriforme]
MLKTIGFWHYRSGDALTIELYPLTGGAILNTVGGDSLVEQDAVTTPGYYSAELELDQGRYRARIFRTSGLVYDGVVVVTETDVAVVQLATTNPVQVESLSNAALAQLTGGRSVTVTVPTLCERELSQPLIRGDSYLAAHNRALDFARSDFPDLGDDCVVTLTARHTGEPDVQFQVIGSVVTGTGTKVVRCEITSEQSRTFVPGKYEFDIEVLFPDGNAATFVGPGVWLRVLADLTDN